MTEPVMLSAARCSELRRDIRTAIFSASINEGVHSPFRVTVHPYPKKRPDSFLATVWNGTDLIGRPEVECIATGAILEATDIGAAIKEAVELLVETAAFEVPA